jgi:glucose-1-phosphate thymidylyltransferase
MIITSVEHHAMFKENLGDGTKWGGSFSYACQTAPDGIAQAIDIAHDFIEKDSVCLITGDTIIVGEGFEKILEKAVKAADKSARATVFVDHEYETDQYGRVLLDEKGASRTIVGTSDDSRYYSITGIYVFPNSVLKHMGRITLSERNKFEIISVSQFFHEEDKLQIQRIPNDSTWFDTNTPDNLLKCSLYMQKKSKK